MDHERNFFPDAIVFDEALPFKYASGVNMGGGFGASTQNARLNFIFALYYSLLQHFLGLCALAILILIF